MNSDIRISTAIFTNKKIRKLLRRKNGDGLSSLLSLWINAAINSPDGVFLGYEMEDLMDSANTKDECFIPLLVDQKKQEFDGKIYSNHNWKKHNGYAYYAPERSEKARIAANTRWQMKNKTKEEIK
ncbi:MAG: hypothetical protein PF495_10040 [Spirochaetales bacterium]|jgi:hypothetical protein|nr:hypothetical protein [Spirochaetales bacterium]